MHFISINHKYTCKVIDPLTDEYNSKPYKLVWFLNSLFKRRNAVPSCDTKFDKFLGIEYFETKSVIIKIVNLIEIIQDLKIVLLEFKVKVFVWLSP